jgi:hypothetical protein
LEISHHSTPRAARISSHVARPLPFVWAVEWEAVTEQRRRPALSADNARLTC